MNEIRLKKVGDPKEKELPRGVKLMVFGGKAVFVRTYMGKLFPVPEEEQKRLIKEYGN